MEHRVQGLGFRGLGFRAQKGLGHRVKGSGFRALPSGVVRPAYSSSPRSKRV